LYYYARFLFSARLWLNSELDASFFDSHGKEVRKMLKVLVFDRCEFCDGEAYVYAGEYKDEHEERPVYLPCHACKGSGEKERLVTLREFQHMLDKANAMEPDYDELSKEKPASQYQDIRDAAGI
jgi:hypothetical protein